MTKTYFFFCLLLSVALCQYPYIYQKNPFPHTLVLKGAFPTLDVNLEYYFSGYNLSYNLVAPPFSKAPGKSLSYGNEKISIQYIPYTPSKIDGKVPAFVVLRDGNKVDMILQDYTIKNFSPLPSAAGEIKCFDIAPSHNGGALFMTCNNETSKTNVIYRLRMTDCNVIETLTVPENFTGAYGEVKRTLKVGHVDYDYNTSYVSYFYMFSRNVQTNEWIIQEFQYSEKLNKTWEGSKYSNLNGTKYNPLLYTTVTDFVPFQRYIIFYDDTAKQVMSFDRKSIVSTTSTFYRTVQSYVNYNNKSTSSFHSISGGVRQSDLTDQVLLNIGGLVFHFNVSETGFLRQLTYYRTESCEQVIFSAYSNEDVYIIGTKGNQNRLFVFKTEESFRPYYIIEDSTDASEGAKLFFPAAFMNTYFVRADRKEINVFDRHFQIFTIDKAWTKGETNFVLNVTSQSKFAKETYANYPDIETRLIHFKVIVTRDNDDSVQAMPNVSRSILMQVPSTHRINLASQFHGPALTYQISGIPKYTLKTVTPLRTNAEGRVSRTIVAAIASSEPLIFQETYSSGGVKIRAYRGKNLDGQILNLTLAAEFDLEGTIESVYRSISYSNKALMVVRSRGNSNPERKLYSLNLDPYAYSNSYGYSYGYSNYSNSTSNNTLNNTSNNTGRLLELKPSSGSLSNCSQIHISQVYYGYDIAIYCLDTENQYISWYSFNEYRLTLDFRGQNSTKNLFMYKQVKNIASIGTSASLPGMLIFRSNGNSSGLSFYSQALDTVFADIYIRPSDSYLIAANKLFVISYTRNVIEISDISYLKRYQTRELSRMPTQGISGNSYRTLDLYGCRLIIGSAFIPVNSSNLYVRARCSTSSSTNATYLLIYNVNSENYEYLLKTIPLPQNQSNFTQISAVGWLRESWYDPYDLLSINIAGNISYYAIYEEPHVIINSSDFKYSLKEKINDFVPVITAKSDLSGNSAKIEFELTIAKFQTELQKVSADHLSTLQLASSFGKHNSSQVCVSFNPAHLWNGTVLEIYHQVQNVTGANTSYWAISNLYTVHNRLRKIDYHYNYNFKDFRLSNSYIYYLGNNVIYIASVNNPRYYIHTIPLGIRDAATTLTEFLLCPNEDCLVAVGKRRNNTFIKTYNISTQYNIKEVGEIPSRFYPDAFTVSDDGLLFTVFDYDPNAWLSKTFIAVFDPKNLQRNWTLTYSQMSPQPESDEAVEFHEIVAVRKGPGEYIVYVTNNATGLLSCTLTLPSQGAEATLKCVEYNLNELVSHDLMTDEQPNWVHVKLMPYKINLPHKLSQKESHTLLLSGSNTPIYIVDVPVEGGDLSIIQGFINYHQVGEQLQVDANKNYVVSYVNAKFPYSRLVVYIYELTNNHSVRVSKSDTWTLEEAYTRVGGNYIGQDDYSALNIHSENNTLYFLDRGQVSVYLIEQNASICRNGSSNDSYHYSYIPGNVEYDLLLTANNDMNNQTYKWHISSRGDIDKIEEQEYNDTEEANKTEPEIPKQDEGTSSKVDVDEPGHQETKGENGFIKLLLVGLGTAGIIFLAIFLFRRNRAPKPVVHQELSEKENVGEMPPSASSYKKLEETQ
eukprot:CAMPEP_0176417104 /NCGR_PEP_ID=MMETSP0127-20121128/6703_1 /TAXON_ID=938130 /ORGANISM="Platyophrya macrostoma, Strain WH" /LENGTH=1583 /DNA_ID=CAMNT_0017797227 /DNA_START=28 /DNA_END=4779 /DNA_ORIENTATION=-